MTSKPSRPLAVVTGAASGIGLAVARQLNANGYGVIGVDLSDTPDELNGVDDVWWVRGDVTRTDTWSATVELADIVSHEEVLAIVANAAAVLPAPIATASHGDLLRVFDVIVGGAFLAITSFLPAMLRLGRGSIVTIGSVDSFVAERGVAAYCAAKGALLQFTRAVALDLAPHGIRANCVCPGVTDTPGLRTPLLAAPDGDRRLSQRAERNPIGRLVQAEEVAAVVRFLCSDAASGVTGSCWPVDGGLSASFE